MFTFVQAAGLTEAGAAPDTTAGGVTGVTGIGQPGMA